MADIPAKCPGAPTWNTITAIDKAVWLPANETIERSYKETPGHDRDAILMGSDFVYGGEIRLPRNAPHRGYGNVLLSELRGLVQQLRPDIIDFKNRVFYEIKSERNAIENRGKVREQLAQYYKLAETIRIQHGGGLEPEWAQANATWKPPLVLPFPGDPANKLICTAATDYTFWPNGLILYDVRAKAGTTTRKRSKVKRFVMHKFDDDFRPVLGNRKDLINGMEAFSAPEIPDFVITVPMRFHEEWKRTAEMNRELDLMQTDVPPAFDARQPLGRFRLLGWKAVGGASAVIMGSMFVMVSAAVLVRVGPLAASAAAAAGEGGIASTGAEVIALNAVRVMRAVPKTREIAAAAGVLAVLGTPKYSLAKHEGTNWTLANLIRLEITDLDAVRVLPVQHFRQFGGLQCASDKDDVQGDSVDTPDLIDKTFAINTLVMYNWRPQIVIGRGVAEYA